MFSASPIKAWLFVVIQFGCLIAIAATGPLVARNVLLLAVEILGGVLIAWAVWSARVTKLSVLPETQYGARLVERGPYAFIRHPMYAALLLISLALVLDAPSTVRFVVWGVLLVNLVLKLLYEEERLRERFAGYLVYQMRTKRLVPFIF